ncbi:kinase-like domain-containing protein [Rhypophila decipiens]|uniref:Kinase-like domain-containing protein n=1 Tax=Rhypophila decipiens TaxID=261697 RepID=A0AAN7B9J8_9PEZI|nr:kinase-like domain-containing protein [Rhypophila decipiens]
MADQTSPLPNLPSEITPEWLGSKLGHKIKSLSNTRNIWGTGSKLFYTITYEDDDDDDDSNNTNYSSKPTHVCIKGVFAPKMLAAQPWTLSLAQRESDFFSLIAPSLQTSGVPIEFPRAYWSGKDANQGIAIMQDLTHANCTFAPEVASYPYHVVLDGVEQLASLHAKFWGQSQDDPPSNAWIWNNYDPAMKFMCLSWDEAVRAPGRPKLPEFLMDGRRCNEALDRYFAERNPRFRTLLHGDTHIGNVYFTSDNKIGFLDWSAFHFGSCFHDVVYHMTSMLSVEDRRAHEMEILDHYLDALHRLGGPRLDRENDPEVMIEYRRSFMTNVIWLIVPDGLQSKERTDVLCERAVAAYQDHGVIDLILGQPKPVEVSSVKSSV